MNKIIQNSFWENLTKRYTPYLIIGLAVIIAYSKAPSFDFSGLDDKLIIFQNFNFLKDLSNIPKAFNTDAFISNINSPFYRPLQTVSYIFDTQFVGDRPVAFIYHLVNIIFHLLNSFFLYVLFNNFQNNKLISLILSLIYSVNPLFVHTVAWIPARGDILVNTFIILSFIFWIKYLNTQKSNFLYLNSLFFIMALFSKEIAGTTPLLFLFYQYLKDKNNFEIRKIIKPIIFWGICILIYFLLRRTAVTSNYSEGLYNIDNLFQNLPTIFEFISKFVLGINLSPLPDFNLFVTYSGFLILVVISLYLYFYKNFDFKPILFGILWIFVFLLPTLMFKHGLGEFAYKYLEHRAYLPLIGFLFILIPIINNLILTDQNNYKKISILILILYYTLHTYVYSETYRNPFNLYTRAIETNPKSAMAYYNRGVNLRNENKINEAFRDINKALEIYPNYVEALYDRAILYHNSNQINLAAKDYERYLMFKPNNYIALNSLAVIYGMNGRYNDALILLNRCIKLMPNNPAAYNNRGYALFLQKKINEALNDFNTALTLNNRFADAYLNRGNLYYEIGKKSEACIDWQNALNFGNQAAKSQIDKFCN